MNRTTIMLPDSLKAKASRLAAKRGISLGELIREGLTKLCAKNSSNQKDAFFSDDHTFTEETPDDLSVNHDDYLYK